MENYNKIQKRFLKYLLSYKKNAIETKLGNVFYEFLEKEYSEFKIEIEENEINFFKKERKIIENCYEKVDEVISLLYLIRILEKEKYIFSYGIEENEEFNNPEFSDYIIAFSLDINFSDIKKLLRQKYIIDPKLRELNSRGFISVETKNLKYTFYALVTGIVINGIGFWLQWYIANEISTVIKFENFDNLKYIAELIKNLKY